MDTLADGEPVQGVTDKRGDMVKFRNATYSLFGYISIIILEEKRRGRKILLLLNLHQIPHCMYQRRYELFFYVVKQ